MEPVFEFLAENKIDIKANNYKLPFGPELFKIPESEKGKKNTRSGLAKMMDKIINSTSV